MIPLLAIYACGANETAPFEPVVSDQYWPQVTDLKYHLPEELGIGWSSASVGGLAPGQVFVLTLMESSGAREHPFDCKLDGVDFHCSDLSWPGSSELYIDYVSITGTWLAEDAFRAQFAWVTPYTSNAECCDWWYNPNVVLAIDAEIE